MKQRILIIGSGFAGMWSAISAARLAWINHSNSLEVILLSPQPELQVRPRFYQENITSLVAPLQPLFSALQIKYLEGYAERFDEKKKIVCYRNSNQESTYACYDRLILACGSYVLRPDISGIEKFTFDIDQLDSAHALEKHLEYLSSQPESEARNTVVVCGGGFTGIELATELPGRLCKLFGRHSKIKIVVVDRKPLIGAHYSEGLREAIRKASECLNVEWRLDSEVESVDGEGVTLKGGAVITSSTVIWTGGVRASSIGEHLIAERDTQGRFIVDESLKIRGYDDIFAAGDMAHALTDDAGNTTLMSCQHAIQLGKFAGNNAAASLLGITALPYRQEKYVTCLDLGGWGAVYTEGWEQDVKLVQKEAKKLKNAIINQLIYPPEAERDIAFRSADPLAKFV